MQNYMGNVMQAFQGGQQMRQQMDTRKALGALVGNPEDPKAMQMLGQANPEMAMQYQERQRKQALAEIEAKKDKILTGAQIFRAAKARNPNAPDEQIYASILPTLGQLGIDPNSLPQPGDPQLPQYLQSIMAIADGLAPQQGQQAPGMIREYQTAVQQGLIDPNTTYEQYVTTLGRPALQQPITIGHNVRQVGGGQQGNLPAVSSPQEAASLPPGTQFRLPDGRVGTVPGGAGSQAPGPFSLKGLPGERVTSTRRSPAKNKAVGGVPNSYHLSGMARDSVPPPGMSMAQYAQALQRLNPHLQVINEGDHVHMEPR